MVMDSSVVNAGTIVRSAVISLIITMIAFLIFALLLYTTELSDSAISNIVFVITVLAVSAGGFFSARNAEKSGFLHGGTVAVVYFAILFVCSLVINKGSVFNLTMLIRFAGCIAAGMLGGIIGINTKSKKKKYRSAK